MQFRVVCYCQDCFFLYVFFIRNGAKKGKSRHNLRRSSTQTHPTRNTCSRIHLGLPLVVIARAIIAARAKGMRVVFAAAGSAAVIVRHWFARACGP